ncbi:MAG: hypothetical protein AAFQ42_11725 [Pseudomonadota bacterium]
MSVSDFYWSERARSEFAALFDDAAYADGFRRAVAETLVRGWSNNRDKPFWSLSIVVAALSAADGSGDGMDIIWRNAGEIRATLTELSPDALAHLGIKVRDDDASLLLETPDGAFRLTQNRLRLLSKLTEFFLGCDEFAYAEDVMGLLARCTALAGDGDYGTLKEITREFARIGYRFRTNNFLDAHAGSAFSIVNSYLAGRNYTLEDDTIFAFWADPENERYKTYEATYQAFANFAASMDEARTTNAASNADDIADPALAGAIAGIVANDDAEVDTPGQDLVDVLGDEEENDDADEPEMRSADPSVLGDADLRLFGQKEITLLSRLAEIGQFGAEHRRASLRLIAFHPVQSGISNGLRTGKWKVPLSERVTCTEARDYDGIISDIEALGARATSWLEVAFALASEEDAHDERTAGARAAGLETLARSRAKALQRDPAELRLAFLGVTPALVQAREMSDRFAGLFSRLFAADAAAEDHASDAFATDRSAFAAEFARRYIADGSGDTASSVTADAAGASGTE